MPSYALPVPGVYALPVPGADAVPVPGHDLPWYGPPQTLAPVDFSMLGDADWLYLYGIKVTPRGFWCGYCESEVRDPEAHLGAYYKESKKRFKATLFAGEQQQLIANEGWKLKGEGGTLSNGCFACDNCNTVGCWLDAFSHIDKKNTSATAQRTASFKTLTTRSRRCGDVSSR